MATTTVNRTISMDNDVARALAETSAQTERPMSRIINAAIREYLGLPAKAGA